jgi:signal transduction histidine kinase
MRMPNSATLTGNMVPMSLRLLQGEQLAALRQLAAGTAHGILNPLTSIKLLVQTLHENRIARGGVAKDFQNIEQEIRRIEVCLQTLLDYSQPPQPLHRPLDLAQQVGLVLAAITDRARNQHVSVEYLPPGTSLIVMSDCEQIHQILLNLTLNALNAMKSGGELKVTLAELPDYWVDLSIMDTGPGIADELLPSVFQPFFSTKESGLGLGLATSRQLAEANGGSLTATNRPEGGACFRLRLPSSNCNG